MKHEHDEAFKLLVYTSRDGSEREIIWNSRDGAVPMFIRSVSGDELVRSEDGDRYMPTHEPRLGDRIFVDLTEERARALAAATVRRDAHSEEKRRELNYYFATHAEAINEIATAMLLDQPADVQVVDHEYLNRRARQSLVARGIKPLTEEQKRTFPERVAARLRHLMN